MPKIALVVFLGLLAALAHARPEPSFDPRDVVRQVRSAPSAVSRKPSADDGEFLIDTSVIHLSAPYDQSDPALAYDGTNFLVVWTDYRNGSSSDIYGTRVSPDGAVLDPSGIPMSTAAGCQGYPVLSFDGANFLVVWMDGRNGEYYDIYGARVTPQGMVLDSSGIPVSTAADWQGFSAIAFGGTNFLVVWHDNRSGSSDVYGARVSSDGTVLDPTGIPISTAANSQYSPAVAFDGTNFLVVWTDYRNGSSSDIYGTRVSPDGTVLDPSGIPISTAASWQDSPAVAFDAANCFVTWTDCRGGEHYDIYGARVTPEGSVLDTAGIPVASAPGIQCGPAVAFDGVNSLVVWSDSRGDEDVYGARVTPQGTVLDPDGLVVSQAANGQKSPALGFDGTNYLVVWDDGRGSEYCDIYGARVSQGGTVLDPSGILISGVTNSQASPAAAFDGENYLVVWEDWLSEAGDIYGARVTPSGTVLDSSRIAVSGAAGTQWSPAVSFGGAGNLAVWTDERSAPHIYGARVSQAGTVLDPDGILISPVAPPQYSPAVSCDGTNWLVVWEDWRSGGDIYGARVDQAGMVLDSAAITISAAPGWQVGPAVSFDGVNWLVVWGDYRYGQSSDIYSTRVTPAGAVLDPSGIPVSTAAHWQLNPAASFDGTNWLVVWHDWRGGSDPDVYGTRVSPAGTVLDSTGIPLSAAAGWQEYPAVSFDGISHFAVWQDYRSGGSYDIYGCHVTPGGAVVDCFLVVTQEGDQQYPALARGPGSQMSLVYEGWAGTVAGKTYNAKRIWGKMNPFPGIAEAPKAEVPTPNLGPTIVRGVLRLSPSPSAGSGPSWLLDAAGRKVLALKPGENDIRHLAPGVYFVCEEGSRGQGGKDPSRKVVVLE